MNTDKSHIRNLARICAAKGIKHAVISPGSRCAPLTIAFNRTEGIECLSVVDERSAAFFALGIAQQTLKPVVLICTSGSAILNYAPALAEAYYQKIPLLVITADRPNEWIDQGENQSILQFEVYKNFIKKSFQLPVQVKDEKDLWFCDRMTSEAINTSLFPDHGPVHINVPLREPLYNLVETDDPEPKVIDFPNPVFQLGEKEMLEAISGWNAANKKLIVVGAQKSKDHELQNILSDLSQNEDVVVLKEATSNVYGDHFFDRIDPLIELITKLELNEFVPDLVLTMGGPVVSKKLKFWLRSKKNVKHWHITRSFEHWDNFQSLSGVIQSETVPFLEGLKANSIEQTSGYRSMWTDLNIKCTTLLRNYLKDLPFCDFKVMEKILPMIPSDAVIHYGNSTPVRYANLIEGGDFEGRMINANRGVSGIDGTSSTATGAAYVQANKPVYHITGDMAFLYDSNALWIKHDTQNLKIILINNSGGNIFRIIPGPDTLSELEAFFETKADVDVASLCKAFNVSYFEATNEGEIEERWQAFSSKESGKSVFEIKTDNEESAKTLRAYFNYLVNNLNT